MNATDSAIQLLTQARRGGPPPACVAVADASAAYAVQAGVAQALGWFGSGTPTHWKSGGPAGPAPLTHAPLPPAGVWASPAAPQGWPWRLPHVEAEIALRLARPVDAALAATLDLAQDAALVHSLIDAMAVSIELVDFRWAEGLAAPAWAKLADQQSHAALVLGDWQHYDPAHNWAAQVCRVRLGDAPEQVFVGSHSLGHPAAVLPQWLRHATQGGVVLPAGSVVTTGTWCGLLATRAGEQVALQFDGIGQASVRL